MILWLFWWVLPYLIVMGVVIGFFLLIFMLADHEENNPGPYPNHSAKPPRWMRDPVGHYALRWWDGTRWTDVVCEHLDAKPLSDPIPPNATTSWYQPSSTSSDDADDDVTDEMPATWVPYDTAALVQAVEQRAADEWGPSPWDDTDPDFPPQ